MPPKDTLHLTAPKKEKHIVRADEGLPVTARMKQTFKFIYVHYPKNWLFDEAHGFLPDVQKIVARPGLNNVRRDGSMSITLAKVRDNGGTVIEPHDERLGDYQDYVRYYEVRGGGKYYVDFNKAATVLPNDEIIWNQSEQRETWYQFLGYLKSTGIIQPMLREIYIGLREKEQKKHDSMFARVERNPHLAGRLQRSARRLEAMDREWQNLTQELESSGSTLTPKTHAAKVDQ